MNLIPPNLRTLSQTVNHIGRSDLSRSQEAYYQKNLAPLEKELENHQRIACHREQKIILVCIFLLMGVTLTSIYQFERARSEPVFGWILLALSYAVAWNLFHINCDRYNKIYSYKVYPMILNYFDDEFTLSREKDRLGELNRFGIVPAFNRVAELSYVRGRYKTVDIELLNARLIQVTNDSETTRFNGLLIFLKIKKPFLGRTIITSDRILTPVRILGGLQRIHLESSEFNNVFNVYSEDQIEARTLLTPASMLRFLDLQKLINQRVNFSFCSGTLLIPFDKIKNNLGLQSIHKKVNIRQNFEAICNDLQIIFEIIDILKLDLEIGL